MRNKSIEFKHEISRWSLIQYINSTMAISLIVTCNLEQYVPNLSEVISMYGFLAPRIVEDHMFF